MKAVVKRWGVRFALALFATAVGDAASATEISVSSFQVGGFYGPYMPGDDPPPGYPAVPAPDNSPGFQNYFMGRSTISGFTTSERRVFFIYDMAGIAASIPPGEEVVGVSIDLTLIDGGTSALANFSGGFEVVDFTATPVPASTILAPGPIPPASIWATFGTGVPYGSFVITGIPDGPKTTPDGTYTIGLPGAVSAIGPSIATSSLFVVSARLATFDPGPIGAGAPPPVDPYEYVFGLTDVESPTGSHAPIPYLTITTAVVPEPSTLVLCLSMLPFLLLGFRRAAHRCITPKALAMVGFLLAMVANPLSASAATVSLTATDSGFVTEAGGSAKGDGPVAMFNYSVGFEVHYADGAPPPPLAPMLRKNYFVFDFSTVTDPIIGATLKLFAGTLESDDPFETYILKETPDQPGALGDTVTLKTTPHPSGFDSPGDPAIGVAASLYGKIGAGPKILASVDVTHADDATILSIPFTFDGIMHLDGLRLAGGPHVLGGLVTTVSFPDGTPQQPFGFTGPDIPGGDPLTPVLELITIPEPSSILLMLIGAGIGAFFRRRRAAAIA